ncbi:GatB/YqeY domain-containing protein (plasmid) [Citricoccus nitrophenolicus]
MTTKLFTAYQVHPRNSEIRDVMGVPAGEPLRLYVQARGKRDALRVLAELGESRLRSTDLEETTPRRSDDFQKELRRQYLPPENVVYYAKADVDVPVVRLRLVGRIGIPAVDVAGHWRRVITEGRHHYAFDRADPEVFLPDPKDPAVMAAIDRALAALGLTTAPATCTCLHPGWPATPCRLHPEARPKTSAEAAEFARQFDAKVEACHAARTPTPIVVMTPTSAEVGDQLPAGWITELELDAVVESILAELDGPSLGSAMKAVTGVVAGRQDPKLIYRMVKARIG